MVRAEKVDLGDCRVCILVPFHHALDHSFFERGITVARCHSEICVIVWLEDEPKTVSRNAVMVVGFSFFLDHYGISRCPEVFPHEIAPRIVCGVEA